MGMCYAAKILDWADRQIGYHEKASNSQLDDDNANSGSANWNKYAAYIDANFPGFYNGKKNGYDWCDVFVDAGMLQCYGYADALRLTCQPEKSCGAGCYYSLGYYKAQGRFYRSKPEPGDQIFFGTSLDNVQHTGIVVGVNEYSGTVTTVEGNTGNMVASHTYPLSASNILGYGRPAYDEPPQFEDVIVNLHGRIKALEDQLAVYATLLDVPSWARPEIQRLCEQGIIQGDGAGRLNIPKQALQAYLLMARVLERVEIKEVG